MLEKPQTIENIPIDQLYSFPNHPYKVEENEDMHVLMQSIVQQQSILVPLLVWEYEPNVYIILGGHRRTKACILLNEKHGYNITHLPCIVYRNITLEDATIIMVDDNCKREKLLPSEKAGAYRMKLEAMKKQGKRNDLTSRQVVGKSSETADIISDEESGRQVQRYIRLTYLIPELLELVDKAKITFSAAVALSYLSDEEQRYVLSLDVMPNLKQSENLKKLSQSGAFNNDIVHEVLTETSLNDRISFRATPTQLAQLNAESQGSGISRSEILRAYSATGGTVYVGNDAIDELIEARATASRLGNLLKMQQNKLDIIIQNPLLAQSDREALLSVFEEAERLHKEIDAVRKDYIKLYTKIRTEVNQLNKHKL